VAAYADEDASTRLSVRSREQGIGNRE
jgi:hypothetical protein